MADYDFTAGPRKGKVYKEKYYLRNNKNFIQEAKKYIPINSQWLTKEEFKNYILSLLDKGIPQIYVVEELPEDLFPYALIFVQNEQGTSVYVDKEGIRTEIEIGGDDNYDAVDIVNEVPEEPRDNTVYFVNDDQVNKNKDKNENLDCDIYVCDNNELRKVTIKDPDVDLIKEVIEEIKTKSLENVYNANLAINELVSTDSNGKLQASGINSSTASTVVTGINTKSLKNIYNTTLTTDKLIYTDNDGCLAASDISKTDAKNVVNSVKNKCLSDIYNKNLTINRLLSSNGIGKIYATDIHPTTASNVINGVATKSLQNLYNNTVDADKVIVSDSSGVLVASDISKTDAKDVVDGVKNGSIKNIYSSTQTSGRLIRTDNKGYLAVSDIVSTTAEAVITGVRNNCLSNIYDRNLIANRLLSSNGAGKVYATDIHPTTAFNVINGVSTKSLKNVYNTTLDAYKFLGTDQNGLVTTVDRPHLFAHHFHYDHGGKGEVNFIVYSPLSSEIDNTTLGDYFTALGCTEYYRAYPAYGQSQRTGGIVSGVYVKENTIPFVKYTIWVNSYTINGNYQEEIGNYLDSTKIYITEVF